MAKLFLIDGSAIFYRSYFAFIRNPLINSKGENTSATFGFLNTLFKLIEDEHPEYLSVVFDTKEPTFRHGIYDAYKATREKMPEEMSATFPRLIQALQTLRLNILDYAGFEADDIIATLARRYANDKLDVFIVSGDKDLAQLVNDHIYIYTPGKGGGQPPDIIDRQGVKQKYGVFPDEIIDWLALVGDKSDNVPGVPSVGEKTAVSLLETFGSLEGLFKRLDEVERASLQDKIRENRDQARLSKRLVTLESNVPLDTTLDDLALRPWDQHDVEVLLKDMEFNRLVARASAVNQSLGQEAGSSGTASVTSFNAKYELITEPGAFGEFLNRLKKSEEFVFDLETDSLDTLTAKIAGIAISLQPGSASYIALNHPDTKLKADDVLGQLKSIFSDGRIRKIAQNIKFDAMVMEQNGVAVANQYFDTMIASFLVNSTSSQHNLDNLAREYLNYKMIPIEDIIGAGKNQRKMTDLPAEDVYVYACEDADITYRLTAILKPMLADLDLERLFYTIEMPLVEVLLAMEARGVALDLNLLKVLSKELEADLEKLEKKIYEMAGEELNINSPQQLGILLFDKLEIHKELGMRKPKRTKTGQYSTSEQILERYHRHALPQNILEFRKLSKLKNTYVDALPGLIHPKTHRVHTSFNQTVAATGRLSSVNPNLQNIPIRTELGREMRRAFIPGEKDMLIMSADYSQVELRLMAHLSGDKKMRESFKQDLDIHAATAAQIMNIPISEVTADHRRKAKEINFGIIYGMSKYGLSNRLDISLEDAEKFIFEYFATYPDIQKFMQETIQRATVDGYVRTIMGRIRYLPQIHSTNRQLREFAERTSINTPIQGSAADLIKKAMIDIRSEIRKDKLKSNMILQVHDELVFEVPEKEVGRMRDLVKSKMENAMQLDVPLKVDIGTGPNWLQAH
jgi:DNA polymerase-1